MGQKGVCLIPRSEGGLLERAKHGPLTDLFGNVPFDMTGETSGRCMVFIRGVGKGP